MYELRAYTDERATDLAYTNRELSMHSDYAHTHTAPAVSIQNQIPFLY